MVPIFHDPSMLKIALTHRSRLNEQKDATESNERMEFLGDAVLELSTSVFLYHTLPQEQEGELTAFRSSLVKTTTLARVARSLQLGEKLSMSKGEEQNGGRENEAILADTFEAIVGALFLDQGYDAADAFLKEHLYPLFTEIKEKNLHKDAKSILQEHLQSLGKAPQYTLTKEIGPDHKKIFTMAVFSGKEKLAEASGKSKQEAQQSAAQAALEKLRPA